MHISMTTSLLVPLLFLFGTSIVSSTTTSVDGSPAERLCGDKGLSITTPVEAWFLATLQGRHYEESDESSLASIFETVIADELLEEVEDPAGSSSCFEFLEKVTAVLIPPEQEQEDSTASGLAATESSMVSFHIEGFRCGTNDSCETASLLDHLVDSTDKEKGILEKFNLAFFEESVKKKEEWDDSEEDSARMVALQSIPSSLSLVNLQREESRNLEEEGCASGELLIPFTFRVVVEFYREVVEFFQPCLPLSTTDKTRISDAYVLSFVSLSSSYCDKYFRKVEAASIIRESFISPEQGILGVEMEVTGTLRCLPEENNTACNTTEIGLYEVPPLDFPSISNRRYLQDEGSDQNCSCPVDAIAQRGLYESEVIDEFQGRLSSVAATLGCQRLSVAECESRTTFQSTIQVNFANSTAAEAKLTEIEAGALDTLNELFLDPNDPNACNPDFRVFQRVHVTFERESRRDIELDLDSRQLQEMMDSNNSSEVVNASSIPTSSPTTIFPVGDSQGPLTAFLSTSGVCSGCSNDIFATNQVNDRHLAPRFEEKTMETAPFFRALQDIVDATSSCFCPLDATIVIGLPSNIAFQAALEDKLDLEITETLQIPNEEEEEAPCATLLTEIPFTYRIIVEFDQACDFLSDSDKTILSDAYVVSFNSLATNFCDPFRREIATASIVQEGVLSVGGKLGVELEVTGTLLCLDSIVCEIADIGLYDIPSLVLNANRARHLLEATDVCPCPGANYVADRGLYESEVVDEFQARVASLAPTLDCLDLSVAVCEFGTIFQSTIQVDFANATAAAARLAEIEAEALATLNEIFSPEDSTTCNPEFRVFEQVQISFGGGSTRRGLQDDLLNITEMDEIGSLFPSSSPTMAPEGIVTAFLSTSGICSGCTNELFLSNQVSNRGLSILEEEMSQQETPVNRVLQATEAISNCFCSLDTTTFVTLPEIEAFQELLENRTQLEITATIQVPEDTGIYSYPCTNVSSVFTKNITLELQYTCTGTGTTPDFSEETKDRIATAFLQTYNGLKYTVCDPFDRKIRLARVAEVGELRAEGNSTPLVLEVEMFCFGCDIDAVDAYGFPDSSSSSDAEAAGGLTLNRDERTLLGRQMEGQTCACPADLPRRAPLEAKVTDALDPVLQSLALPCIGNTTQCDFGATFVTNVLLEVQLDASLGAEATARTLQTAYTNTLGALINGGNETQCNKLFGFVTNSEFFLNFVYNSLERGSNETAPLAERQLQEEGAGNFSTLFNSSSEAPSSAPTSFVPSTAFVLISASGVCNGCPSDLFFGDQTSNRRKALESSSKARSEMTSSVPRFLDEILSGIDTDVPESDCYCPIGSAEIPTVFEPASFSELLQKAVNQASNATRIQGSSYGVTQVECSEETAFETTVQFEFSAFQWVVDNDQDVQGFGNEIATAYNDLVVKFCDEYFRNSISLTYKPGTLQPTGNGRRHDRDRKLQQAGCFNYVAQFAVIGKCRGCQALSSSNAVIGSPIPLFGASEDPTGTRGRELDSPLEVDHWGDRTHGSLSAGSLSSRSASFDHPAHENKHRRLASSTCVCDAGAFAQKSAPSLASIKTELQNIIPATLPWNEYPSICGMPVAAEVQCSEMPSGPLETFVVSLYVRRRDGSCLSTADLSKLAADYLEVYNVHQKKIFFPCEPDYIQITAVDYDETIVGDCLRRREQEMEEGVVLRGRRSLVRDHIRVDLSVSARQTKLSIGDAYSKVVAGSPLIMPGIQERNAVILDQLLLEASHSPSAIPSTEPSALPSSFPSEFPTSGNCFEGAFQIEDAEFEEALFIIPDELDTCGVTEDEGIVFEWDEADKKDLFVSVEFDGEATGESLFVVFEFDDPGICTNWDCSGTKDSIVCVDGCCTEVERGGKLPNVGVVGYNTEEQPLRVVLNRDKTPCFPTDEILVMTETLQTFQTIDSATNTCGLGVSEGLKSAVSWDGSTDGRIVVQPVSGDCERIQLWQVPSVDSYCFEWELLENQMEANSPVLFDLSLYSDNPGFFMVVIYSSTECESSLLFAVPTAEPSSPPTDIPSSTPSRFPSEVPSTSTPSMLPSEIASSTPSVLLTEQPTHGGCFTGTYNDVRLKCPTTGTNKCLVKSGNYTGTSTICPGACNGPDACTGLGPNAYVGPGSCSGTNACRNLGSNSDGSKSITIGANSCIGTNPCINLGADAVSTSIEIGTDSCICKSGPGYCCNDIAKAQTGSLTVEIGNGSCAFLYACTSIGYNTAETVKIGNGSCNNDQTCNRLGMVFGTSIEVEKDACQKVRGCDRLGQNFATSVLVRENACKGNRILKPKAVPRRFFRSEQPTQECFTGTYPEVSPQCPTTGTNRCLVGSGAYQGTSTICPGACNGAAACTELGPNAYVVRGSCSNANACKGLGLNSDGSKSITIGTGSCLGENSCEYFASQPTGLVTVNIGDGSCLDKNSCSEIAEVKGGYIQIGDGSCTGENGCQQIGATNSDYVEVANTACLEARACQSLGNATSNSVFVGLDACVGVIEACGGGYDFQNDMRCEGATSLSYSFSCP